MFVRIVTTIAIQRIENGIFGMIISDKEQIYFIWTTH